MLFSGNCLNKYNSYLLFSFYFFSETQKIPKIKRHLSDIKCSDGDSIKFECEIDTDENFSDVDVYWYKNGKVRKCTTIM